MRRSSNSSLSGQIGLLVDRATNGAQPAPEPGLTTSIVHFAANSDDGAKEVARAIRKRLGTVAVAKDFKAARHCLDLLDACVQRCGNKFHLQLGAKRDLLEELLRLISPKYAAPPDLQEKILQLLASWSEQFRDRPELKELDRTVRDLRAKGVCLPDAVATYESLAVYASPAEDSGTSARQQQPLQPQQTQPPPPQLPVRRTQSVPMPAGAHTSVIIGRSSSMQQQQQLSPHQLGRLKHDVDQVCANCRVFNEILTDLGRSGAGQEVDEASEDVRLLRQLNETNRQMQQRLMQLLGQITDESVMNELLRVNDDLNSAFLRYDRFENSRQRPQQQPQLPTQPSPQPATVAVTADQVNLIDLSDLDEALVGVGRFSSGAALSGNPGNLPDTEAELAEMESWMVTEGLSTTASTAHGGGSGGDSAAIGGTGLQRFEL